MHRKIESPKTSLKITLIACLSVLWMMGTMVRAQTQSTPVNPAQYAYPALGATAKRKVDVAWNRYYDCAGLEGILTRLHGAFPQLTEMYSIGTSTADRSLWCLEVTARDVGDSKRKTGMYIDGDIHGNEVQGSEVVAYTAWYLCHQYGRNKQVTSLLNDRVFYLVPTINPDGRDSWLHQAHTSSTSRSGVAPLDNDQDGLCDEDDVDDLNGDGHITNMRIKDPHGRYKPHPDYPDYLMLRVKPGERGQYTLLGREGIDNDKDGQINEDGRGGYDMNRNWAFDWQPNYVQRGAQDYPFSQPETRAVAEFILRHPNIAAAHSYHNSGGLILRGPGRAGGEIQSSDERVLQWIGDRGQQILPYYRSIIIAEDLYTVWGGALDWFYGARGILTFSNELWTSKNLYKDGQSASQEERADFLKHVLLGEGIIPWEEYDHPTYGKIEIGGTRKEWGRIPPSFLLEEELHRNMAFTLFHAHTMPLLRIADVNVTPLAQNLHEVWVTVENQRLIPTRTGQDIAHHITAPDVVSIAGAQVKALSAGKVLDPYFKKVEAVKRRPERVELDSIKGMGAVRVRFVVTGTGPFTITVDSVKGGRLETEGRLP